MKVECIKIISSITDEVITKSLSLSIGSLYTVLAVSAAPNRETLLRIVRDDLCTPAMFDSRQFRTVCSRIPSSWRAMIDEAGHLKLAPEKWLRQGFWEDYFNNLPSAVEEFNEEKAKIIAESA